MKKFLAVAIIIAAITLVSPNASAQAANDSNWVSVNAKVVGIFDFQIDSDDWNDPATDAATYNFGDVSLDGTTTGGATPSSTDGFDTNATFTADNAFGWSVISAPKRDVAFSFQNVNTSGSLGASALAFSMDDANFFDLSSPGTVHSVTNVGNGSQGATGNIDLELTITDSDAPGTSSFTFEIVATGL